MAYADALSPCPQFSPAGDEKSQKFPRGTAAGRTTPPSVGIGGIGAGGTGECAVVLGDRDVQETLKRLGGAFTALTGQGDRLGKTQGARTERGGEGTGRTARVGSAGGVAVLGSGGVGELDVEVRRGDWEQGERGRGGRGGGEGVPL